MAVRFCRLDPPPELLVKALDGVGCAHGFPLAGWQAGESEQLVASFLQAVGHRVAFQPPFAQKGLAALVLHICRIGIDRIAGIFGQLIVHVAGRMAEQIEVLVGRAPLNDPIVTP